MLPPHTWDILHYIVLLECVVAHSLCSDEMETKWLAKTCNINSVSQKQNVETSNWIDSAWHLFKETSYNDAASQHWTRECHKPVNIANIVDVMLQGLRYMAVSVVLHGCLRSYTRDKDISGAQSWWVHFAVAGLGVLWCSIHNCTKHCLHILKAIRHTQWVWLLNIFTIFCSADSP